MTGEYVWDPGEANPKQKLFFASRKLYTAYGGAKGGGKTWAVRTACPRGGGPVLFCRAEGLLQRDERPALPFGRIEATVAPGRLDARLRPGAAGDEGIAQAVVPFDDFAQRQALQFELFARRNGQMHGPVEKGEEARSG